MVDEKDKNSRICGEKCEVFSRIVGYYRPVNLWNEGKKEEFKHRKTFIIEGEKNGY